MPIRVVTQDAVWSATGPPGDLTDYQRRDEKGQANGYASLDGTGHLSAAQIPDPGAAFADAINAGQGIDVATTSTPVVSANVDRTLLILSNGSDTAIWVQFATAGAAVGNGIQIPANDYREFVYAGAACAIHGASGTKRLGVTEL